jgi:5'(3')-deoxyribonucleotidase
MKIKPDRVGFDFDGVIADIGEAFIRLACTDHGYCSIKIEELTSFQVEHCLQVPTDVIEIIFDDILVDPLGIGLKPLPGAIETIGELCNHSLVTVITARHEIQPVIDWFDHYCAPEDCEKIKLIATGDHDDKEGYIRTCGLTHFIDDRALTCLQLAKVGLQPIVFSQPWNHNQHDLPTVADWAEIYSLFDFSGGVITCS